MSASYVYCNKAFASILRNAAGYKLSALGILILPLTGCVTNGPDFASPDPLLPVRSFSGPPAPAAASADLNPAGPKEGSVPPVNPRWWTTFRDPLLTSLIEKAAEASLDVRTATLRIAESRFQRGVTASALFPTLNGDAQYTRQLYSQNGITSLAAPLAAASGSTFSVPAINVFQPSFDASWELDIFGHVQRQVEAADAQIEQSEFQRRDTLVSTLAEVAQDYMQLRGVQSQISITTQNLKTANEILELTQTRASKGITSNVDVENQAAQVESIRAQLPALQNQESQQINGISLLLDEAPGALRKELSSAKPVPPSPPHVPLGIPSELARRRPDIRRAEAQLHTATANVGVAVADFYPRVTLNGNVALNSLTLSNLWKGSSLQYTFGPSVQLPIFDGGRLKGTLQLNEAQQQEAAINYHKTVLSAWHDVVNALYAYQKEQERRLRLRAEVEHSKQAFELSRVRYADGVQDFITTLNAENTYLQAQLLYAQSTANVSTDLVALYKALGGGWEEVFPDTAAPALVAQAPVDQK